MCFGAIAGLSWCCQAESATNDFWFSGPEIFPIDNGISLLHAADLNGDGLKDLIVANNARSKIELLYNQTGHTNRAAEEPAPGEDDINQLPPDARFRIDSIASEKRISAMVVADLNGDGRPDIAYYGVYDSQWTAAYPEIYPAGVLDVGDSGYSDNKLSAEDYTDGYRIDPIVTMTGTQRNRYWSVEFDDTANADGYVQLGRIWIAYGYQPSLQISTGSGLGWRDSSTRTETDGTDAIYDVRTMRRIYDFAFNTLSEDEALVRMFDGLIRTLGTTGQLLFVTDPADTYHMHRRSMLAVLQSLSPLQNKVAAYYDQAYSLVEEI